MTRYVCFQVQICKEAEHTPSSLDLFCVVLIGVSSGVFFFFILSPPWMRSCALPCLLDLGRVSVDVHIELLASDSLVHGEYVL
jgi:hypothetical protein